MTKRPTDISTFTPADAAAMPMLHDADGVWVIDKPAGIATSGRHLRDPKCMQHRLIRRNHGDMVWAVHQLDADTSGVNVFVTRKTLVPVWQERMRPPNGRKQYWAIVHGRLAEPQLTVDAPIGWVGWGDDRRWGVAPKGKASRTHFRELAVSEDGAFSIIQARIESGRTHQIRVHLEHVGLWLVGEPYYTATPCERHHRHALHAWKLRFADGEAPYAFIAPVPADLRELATSLGLSWEPAPGE